RARARADAHSPHGLEIEDRLQAAPGPGGRDPHARHRPGEEAPQVRAEGGPGRRPAPRDRLVQGNRIHRMKLLVTGASGFIGRNLLAALPRDWQVTAAYHRDASFPEFLRKRELAHVTALRVDLADGGAVAALDDKQRSYDACVYLAANGDPAY